MRAKTVQRTTVPKDKKKKEYAVHKSRSLYLKEAKWHLLLRVRTMFEKYKLINTFSKLRGRFTVAIERIGVCMNGNTRTKEIDKLTANPPPPNDRDQAHSMMMTSLNFLYFLFVFPMWRRAATRADTANIRLLGIIRDTIRAAHSSKTADCWETALQRAHTMGIYPNEKTWVDLYYEVWMVHLELTIVCVNTSDLIFADKYRMTLNLFLAGEMARVCQWTKSGALRWSRSNYVRYHQRWVQWLQHRHQCADPHAEDIASVHW